MAELNQMSSKLKSLHDVYPSISGMKTTQSAISESLNLASKLVETSVDGLSSASSDAQVTEAKSCLVLSNDAIQRVKSHVEGDLNALFSNCDEVESYCKRIEELRAEGVNWNPGWWERVWNEIKGFFNEEWRDGDSKKIAEANREIDRLNKKGEAQLTSMSNAINSVAFGVAGNMHAGGSLGNNVTYDDNYNFSPDVWEKENPVYTSNIFTKVGSLTVGAVEGVFKVGEGVLDTGATLVAGVVSLFDHDAGKSIANFAAKDIVGGAADWVSDTLGLHDDGYRNAGKLVGSTVAHGALWMTGGGAIVSAVSVAGSSMESSLQASGGENIWGAIGTGSVVGLSSYALGHFGKALASKFSTWATGTGSTTVFGKAYSALSKAAGTKFGNGWSSALKGKHFPGTVVNKAINIAASPLRGMGHLMTGGSKLIGGSKLARTSMWQKMGALDAKADALSTKVVDNVASAVAKPGQALGKAKNSIANRFRRGNASNGAQNNGGQNNGGQNNGAQNNGGQNNGGQNNGGQNNGGQNNGAQNNGGQNNGGQNNGGQNNGGQNNGAQNNGGQNNGAQNNGAQNNGGQNNGGQSNGTSANGGNGGGSTPSNESQPIGRSANRGNGGGSTPANESQPIGRSANRGNGGGSTPANESQPIGSSTNGGGSTPANGNPVNASNGSVSERGMYGVTDANKMSYNEAQRNLAKIDQYGLLDAFDSPDDIARAQQLWMDSTANVADRMYGGSNIPLKQNGNWYQNAENGARYFGQQGLGNTPDGWNQFTDNVYTIGRLDASSYGPTPIVPTPTVPTPTVPTPTTSTPTVPTPTTSTPTVPTPTVNGQKEYSVIGALVDEYNERKALDKEV